MRNMLGAMEPLAESCAPESTWIQITFTLDPELYRALWQRADEEHQTIPGLVREGVTALLQKVGGVPQNITISAETNP